MALFQKLHDKDLQLVFLRAMNAALSRKLADEARLTDPDNATIAKTVGGDLVSSFELQLADHSRRFYPKILSRMLLEPPRACG